MPGRSATVADEITTLREIAGEGAASPIQRVPDPIVARIVASWPADFDTTRARDAGFEFETSFQRIIEIYLEDEMGGQVLTISAMA